MKVLALGIIVGALVAAGAASGAQADISGSDYLGLDPAVRNAYALGLSHGYNFANVATETLASPAPQRLRACFARWDARMVRDHLDAYLHRHPQDRRQPLGAAMMLAMLAACR